MGKFWKKTRWSSLLGTMLMTGCVSGVQLRDFALTEGARTIADIVGRSLDILIRGTLS